MGAKSKLTGCYRSFRSQPRQRLASPQPRFNQEPLFAWLLDYGLQYGCAYMQNDAAGWPMKLFKGFGVGLVIFSLAVV